MLTVENLKRECYFCGDPGAIKIKYSNKNTIHTTEVILCKKCADRLTNCLSNLSILNE